MTDFTLNDLTHMVIELQSKVDTQQAKIDALEVQLSVTGMSLTSITHYIAGPAYDVCNLCIPNSGSLDSEVINMNTRIYDLEKRYMGLSINEMDEL